MPLIKKYKVSEVARKPGQFLSTYSKHGEQLPQKWFIKRENFLLRHNAQYKNNPTIRRRLAMIVWAHDPEYP